MSAVHRILPQASTSKLTISTFGSPNSFAHLEQVIESVLVDPQVPLKLSAKVVHLLVENFLFHDFSISHFLNGYRFILAEHLNRTPAGMLMGVEEELARKVKCLNLEELSYFCTLPSFRTYMDTLPIEEQAEILVNTGRCREVIITLMKEYYEYVRTFTAMVRILYLFAKDLPRRPMGRQMRDVYTLVLEGAIEKTAQYRETFQFLKLSNRVDLETKLKLAIEQADGLPLLDDFLQEMRESVRKISELDDMDSTESLAGSPVVQSLASRFARSSHSNTPVVLPFSLDNSGITPLPSSSGCTPAASNYSTPSASVGGSPALGRLGTKLDRFELQASLLEASKKKHSNKLARPFDVIRTEAMSYLHDKLKQFLVPPTSKPLHEVNIFTSTSAIRRHLAGAPRAALHTALTDPYLYLEHPDLHISDAGEIPSSLPDVCVGYKLHLECPRLINVFDWLSCWHSIIANGEEKISEENQARFTRVVSELQHLGFVKTSNRKADHVARLTFGGS